MQAKIQDRKYKIRGFLLSIKLKTKGSGTVSSKLISKRFC